MKNFDITIISATNRPGSNTLKVSRLIERMLLEKGVDDAEFFHWLIGHVESHAEREEAFQED